jgi:WD40 repeat protein
MHCQVQGEGVCMHVQKSIYLGDDFEPTCMAHPPTYLNKVLIGGADGTMQLRNINSDTLLYTFNLHSRVCCIEPSPALDVVGVGLADGSAVILNVKFDEQVMKFANAAGAGIGASTTEGESSYSRASPCKCLAFRCALLLSCCVGLVL